MRLRSIVTIAGLGAAIMAAFVFREPLARLLPDGVREKILEKPLALLPWIGTEDEGGPDRRAVAVRLAPVERGRAAATFETSGTILAAEAVVLTSEVAARVERVFVDDGARLEEGDAVIRFEDDAERQVVDAAEAALAEADADLARARQLHAEDVVAETRVETALAAQRRARADLRAAEKALADRTVRAPFGGRIGFIDVSPGAFLDPGEAIASLQTVDDLRVRFALPLEIAEAAEDIASVDLLSERGSCETAEVVTVSPLIDPATRSRHFEARVAPGCHLAPGDFVTVSVETAARPESLFVPHAAVLREGFESYVFRAEEDGTGLVARRVPVEPGVFSGTRIEIREGLAEGERVVASGVQKLSDGRAIRALEEEGG